MQRTENYQMESMKLMILKALTREAPTKLFSDPMCMRIFTTVLLKHHPPFIIEIFFGSAKILIYFVYNGAELKVTKPLIYSYLSHQYSVRYNEEYE